MPSHVCVVYNFPDSNVFWFFVFISFWSFMQKWTNGRKKCDNNDTKRRTHIEQRVRRCSEIGEMIEIDFAIEHQTNTRTRICTSTQYVLTHSHATISSPECVICMHGECRRTDTYHISIYYIRNTSMATDGRGLTERADMAKLARGAWIVSPYYIT